MERAKNRERSKVKEDGVGGEVTENWAGCIGYTVSCLFTAHPISDYGVKQEAEAGRQAGISLYNLHM